MLIQQLLLRQLQVLKFSFVISSIGLAQENPIRRVSRFHALNGFCHCLNYISVLLYIQLMFCAVCLVYTGNKKGAQGAFFKENMTI